MTVRDRVIFPFIGHQLHKNSNFWISAAANMSKYTSIPAVSTEAKVEDQEFLKYSDNVSVNDVESDSGFQPTKSRRKQLISHGVVFFITSLLWMTIMYAAPAPAHHNRAVDAASGSKHNITSGATLVNCGNTTTEARARGCKYDVLLNMWAPAACIDEEFVNEYLDDSSWAAYADPGMTQKLSSIDEISEMDHYYTSVRDHVNHCAVMWKKQFFALFEERNIDTMSASPGHTDHCAQYLIDVGDLDWKEPTKVERGFAGCWIRD